MALGIQIHCILFMNMNKHNTIKHKTQDFVKWEHKENVREKIEHD